MVYFVDGVRVRAAQFVFETLDMAAFSAILAVGYEEC